VANLDSTRRRPSGQGSAYVDEQTTPEKRDRCPDLLGVLVGLLVVVICCGSDAEPSSDIVMPSAPMRACISFIGRVQIESSDLGRRSSELLLRWIPGTRKPLRRACSHRRGSPQRSSVGAIALRSAG